MIAFCKQCEYIDTCEPKRKCPQAILCCDFGLVDEEGNQFDADGNLIFESKDNSAK